VVVLSTNGSQVGNVRGCHWQRFMMKFSGFQGFNRSRAPFKFTEPNEPVIGSKNGRCSRSVTVNWQLTHDLDVLQT
jgi:hypothetical protein